MMQPPESSSDFSSAGSSLWHTKRARQELEKEAKLLESRLNLLQKEEQRVWKRIESTRTHTKKVNEAHQRHVGKLKAKADFYQTKNKRLEDAKDKIKHLRQIRSQDKLHRNDILMQQKKNMADEIRALRTYSDNFRQFLNEAVRQDNMRRSISVKQILSEASYRVKSHVNMKQNQAKASYTDRIENEEKQKQEVKGRLALMESLEMELIARLKDTQGLQQRAHSDLENALNRSRQQTARIDLQSLTQLQ
mmetsp:Transcript_19940/g.36870  ORF Transcript_19940/g.36870 Transcript_19940/m.36870 type:complete len:249 (+) Transcript_19940:4119-4865(+)